MYAKPFDFVTRGSCPQRFFLFLNSKYSSLTERGKFHTEHCRKFNSMFKTFVCQSLLDRVVLTQTSKEEEQVKETKGLQS